MSEIERTPVAPVDSHADEHGMFERFLRSQVTSSGGLVVFALLALFLANSPWAAQYYAIAKAEMGFHIGDFSYTHTVSYWIKDGLMAIFFFVVGLEIKRELVVGELSSVRRALLPVSAAFGGAMVPALIYWFFNPTGPESAGWGVPMATDIAFALGALALFGSRVPIGLKIFLTALAIADDLMAVLVIALFYTDQLNFGAIASAVFFLALIFLANRFRVRQVGVYLILMVAVWASFESSGIHATISGVLLALLVPVRALIGPREFFDTTKHNLAKLEQWELTRESMNIHEHQRAAVNEIYLAAADMTPPGIALEKQLHVIQAFLILPLFALVAAGVKLDATTLSGFPSPVALGIICGLFFGKQIGILLASWLAVKSGWASLPGGVTWSQIWAASGLAGIGFTMSIFIGDLAFPDEALMAEAKIAVLVASVCAGIWGSILLHRFLPKKVPDAKSTAGAVKEGAAA
jgi:NhaA family Na+:H+ antiporter